jgi:hypothetical protein
MRDSHVHARAGLVSLLVVLAMLACAVGTAVAAQWSQPAPLGTCAAIGAARVVFPTDRPQHATGPGAVVWAAAQDCAGGEGARLAAIGASDTPGATRIPTTSAGRQIAPRGALTVSAAPHGQILIGGASAGTRPHGLLVQGSATGSFSPLASLVGPSTPIALANGYLGDVALSTPPASGASTGGPSVRVERFFSHQLSARSAANAGTQPPISAVTLALDYRSDALTVWVQGETLYAHDLPSSGTVHPIQRLAHVGAHVKVAALLSDDNRGTVAWAADQDGETSVYVERSASDVRFSKPQLLERFHDPDGLSSPAGSPSLVRLSSESVMLAWAGANAGHWVVRSTAIDQEGVGGASTLAAPGTDALLETLAPGPDGEALLLWGEPQPLGDGLPDMERQTLFTARALDTHLDRTDVQAPELVAPPGPNSDATVAFDPDDDRALAVWHGAGAQLQYAIRGTPAPAP